VVRTAAAAPIVMPAMAPRLGARLDEGGKEIMGLALEVVLGCRCEGFGVAVADCPDGAAEPMPLAARLT